MVVWVSPILLLGQFSDAYDEWASFNQTIRQSLLMTRGVHIRADVFLQTCVLWRSQEDIRVGILVARQRQRPDTRSHFAETNGYGCSASSFSGNSRSVLVVLHFAKTLWFQNLLQPGVNAAAYFRKMNGVVHNFLNALHASFWSWMGCSET
jgi:hypothetical protein